MNKIYIGDTPEIELDAIEDISGATVKKIKYVKPNGTKGEYESGVTIVDNTKLNYQTNDTDIDIAGNWVYQIYVELVDWKGHGEEFHHLVHTPETV